MQHPPGDPLSNPIRSAIVQRVRAGAATLDQLADAADVHRNTARSHAEALERAGLIERAPSAPCTGAGRPATRYRLAPGAALSEPAPLAKVLGAALTDAQVSQQQARRAASRRAASSKRLGRKRRRAAVLELELSRLGFEVDVRDEVVELSCCPCPAVAPDNPGVVCALAAGTIDGTLERIGSPERVIDSQHDPVARRCRLRLATPD